MAKYAPHTSSSAAARAKAKVGHANAVGMCAHEVIVNIFGIPGPWRWGGNGAAWAVNYFKGAQKVVKTTDPAKIPAGAMVFFDARPGATTNGGRAGHVAVGAGNGYIYSTDLPHSGTWGRVKITEVTRLWGKKLLGYVLVDGMGYTLTDPPVVKPAAVLPDEWFSLSEYNLAGFDTVHGKASWDAREDDLIERIRTIGSLVWGLIEIPDGKLKRFASKLDLIGYKVAVGTDGRYIVVAEKVRVGRTATYTLPERGPAGDDKQAVFAELWPTDSFPVMVEVAQLEYRLGKAYDKTRVTQGQQIKAKGQELAKAWGIPSSRQFWVNDENSDAQVSTQVFGSTWPDAFTVAARAGHPTIATLCGWSGFTRNGPRIDKIHVHKSRKVRTAAVHVGAAGLSDHVPTTVVVGKN